MKEELQNERIEDLMKKPEPGKWVGIVHLKLVKESRTLYGIKRFKEPKAVVEMVRPLFDLADREVLAVMSLNAKNEPLAVEIVAVGGLDSCCVDIRNIFKHALLNNAASIICFHNHPSGYPEPSQEDEQITRRIKESGELLGIRLLDHVIIGDGQFYSFQESGKLEGERP